MRNCPICLKDEFFCICPPPADPARPAWKESYPPLHCIRCGTPMFTLPLMKMTIYNVTCSDECKKEIETRYYRGSVMQRDYGDKR